jgi:hypothetical protein
MSLPIFFAIAAIKVGTCLSQAPPLPPNLQNCPIKSGNMRDLGVCEPDWYPLPQGRASDAAIVPNAGQVWGDIVPGQSQSSLCKWLPPPAGSPPSERGQCQTDISWIISSAQLNKGLFNDTMFNYMLKFQLYGSCYRSTQVRRLAIPATSQPAPFGPPIQRHLEWFD